MPLVPDFPIWDQWHLIPLWKAFLEGKAVLPHLVEPYNGHLNLVPRSVFFVLGLVTRWNMRSEVVISYLVAATTASLLVHFLASSDRRRLILAAPIAAAVFHFAQVESFMSGYHLGQHFCQASLIGMLVLLSREPISGWAICAAALCATVATFSWGAGVVAWPIGGGLLLARRRIDGRVVLWGALAMPMLALVSRTGSPPAVDWPAVPLFLTALLGRQLSPFAFPGPVAATVAGVVGLMAFAFIVGAALERSTHVPFMRALWVVACGVAAALVIALGRASVGPGQSLISHYATATSFFAIGLIALITDHLLVWHDRHEGLSRRMGALPILVLGVFLIGTLVQSAWVAAHALPQVTAWMKMGQEAFGRLLLGTLSDEEVSRLLHPSPTLVRQGVALLQREGWTTFSVCHPDQHPGGSIERVNGKILDASRPRPQADTGNTISVLEGWAVDGAGRVPVEEVRIEQAGRPIAMAMLGLARPALAWSSGRASAVLAGWRAELPRDRIRPAPGQPLVVVALSCNGSRTVIGQVDF